MADGNTNEITIAGRDEGECSDTTVEIKIKTLDSQTYTLRVNKCMPVPALKDQIATMTGVLSEQQRLICRGKVLKDDQLLSAYHVEDGHTLHLVVRQPLQTASTSMAGTGGGDGNTELQGVDSTSGGTRNRNGQVSHSVVLGTFNIPDQGDGGMPDLNRIISAVLSSVGIGNLVPVNSGSGNGATLMAPAFPSRGQQGSDLEGQERTGNASVSSHMNEVQHDQAASDVQFEPFHGAFRFPAAQPLRPLTQTTVIPDSLTTLSQYLDRMSQEFSLNGFDNQPQSTEAEENRTSSGLPSISRGLPSPAALGAIIRRTQQLLSHHVGASFSQLATQLESESAVTDATVRGRIQSAALQNGIIMQNLGALLLELGRTTMTLRMGQSSAESVVNAGPAVYVSTSGPNPMMVQPLPFQPGSSFSAAPVDAARPSAGVTVGTIGAGDVPRSIDIHIRAGTSLAPGSNTGQGEPVSGQQAIGQANQIGNVRGGNLGRQGVSSFVGETGAVRVVPVRTVVAAVPAPINSRPPNEAAGGALGVFYPLLARFQQLNPSQLTQMRSLPLTLIGGGLSSGSDTVQPQVPTSAPLPTIQAEVQVQSSGPTSDQNAGRHEEIRLENLSSLSASTSAAETQTSVCETTQSQAGSSVDQDLAQRRPSNVHIYSIDVGTGNLQRNIDEPNSEVTGSENGSLTELSNGLGQILNGMVSRGQVGNERADVGALMSQLLHNSAINNHSMAFAEQIGTVSTAGLSNIMGQVWQNPFSRNNQLQMEQQMGEGRDLREHILRATFSGLNQSQDGIEISGMLQQMIPVESRPQGGQSEGSPLRHGVEVQTRVSNDERSLADETEAVMPRPRDEVDNGNTNFSDSERQQLRHSDDNENVNIPSDAERQQSEHTDDIYPDVSPVCKRQKTQ